MNSRLANAAAAALALTLLNAAKPLVVDDAAFVQYARQIAAHPTDPYGFEILWYQRPVPASEVLATPVVLYGWALALRAFGPHPLAWKLALFPYALALALSLAALLARFAPRCETSLLWMIVFSPPIALGFNLMLDVPALALALASFALLAGACDRERGALPRALLAGAVAGLALQAKYSALVPVAAGLGYALWVGRWRLGVAAGALAALLFLSWEAAMWARYGHSLFFAGVDQLSKFARGSALAWGLSLASLVGASGAAWGALALLAARARAALVAGFAVAATLGLAGISATAPLPVAPVGGGAFPRLAQLGPELAIPLALGLAVAAAVGAALARWAAARRAELRAPGGGADPARRRALALDLALLSWLGAETLGYFVLSPFPALRRVMGLEVALALLLARLVERAGGAELPRSRLRAVAAYGVGLGLFFAYTDWSDARARRDVVAAAVRQLDAEPGASAERARWYAGHWGFQFHAERLGLRPIVLGETAIRAGDAVVVPEGVSRQPVHLPPGAVREIGRVEARNSWPWSTLPSAYAGSAALKRQPAAQIVVHLYRATADFDPTPPRFKRRRPAPMQRPRQSR